MPTWKKKEKKKVLDELLTAIGDPNVFMMVNEWPESNQEWPSPQLTDRPPVTSPLEIPNKPLILCSFANGSLYWPHIGLLSVDTAFCIRGTGPQWYHWWPLLSRAFFFEILQWILIRSPHNPSWPLSLTNLQHSIELIRQMSNGPSAWISSFDHALDQMLS